MSVEWFRLHWEGRDADGDDKARRYKRVFKAKTNDRFDDGGVVLAHPAAPRFGSLYPTDLFAWCQKITATNEGVSPYFWRVAASYSSEKELHEDPTKQPAEITWDEEPYQVPLVVDRDGEPVTNSADDPYDPPYMVDDSRLVATVVKNVRVVPAFILQYRNVVNSDAFTVDGISVKVGQGKIKAIKVSAVKRTNNIAYRTLTIPISLKEDGWDAKLQDMGFYEYFTVIAGPLLGLKIKQHILHKNSGKQVTVPWPLDGAGRALDPTQHPLKPKLREHKAYKQLPFAPLPLS